MVRLFYTLKVQDQWKQKGQRVTTKSKAAVLGRTILPKQIRIINPSQLLNCKDSCNHPDSTCKEQTRKYKAEEATGNAVPDSFCPTFEPDASISRHVEEYYIAIHSNSSS